VQPTYLRCLSVTDVEATIADALGVVELAFE
jgi:hypothetical protein